MKCRKDEKRLFMQIQGFSVKIWILVLTTLLLLTSGAYATEEGSVSAGGACEVGSKDCEGILVCVTSSYSIQREGDSIKQATASKTGTCRHLPSIGMSCDMVNPKQPWLSTINPQKQCAANTQCIVGPTLNGTTSANVCRQLSWVPGGDILSNPCAMPGHIKYRGQTCCGNAYERDVKESSGDNISNTKICDCVPAGDGREVTQDVCCNGSFFNSSTKRCEEIPPDNVILSEIIEIEDIKWEVNPETCNPTIVLENPNKWPSDPPDAIQYFREIEAYMLAYIGLFSQSTNTTNAKSMKKNSRRIFQDKGDVEIHKEGAEVMLNFWTNKYGSVEGGLDYIIDLMNRRRIWAEENCAGENLIGYYESQREIAEALAGWALDFSSGIVQNGGDPRGTSGTFKIKGDGIFNNYDWDDICSNPMKVETEGTYWDNWLMGAQLHSKYLKDKCSTGVCNCPEKVRFKDWTYDSKATDTSKKIMLLDPPMGPLTPSDNTLTKTDALSQFKAYEFEFLNRLSTEPQELKDLIVEFEQLIFETFARSHEAGFADWEDHLHYRHYFSKEMVIPRLKSLSAFLWVLSRIFSGVEGGLTSDITMEVSPGKLGVLGCWENKIAALRDENAETSRGGSTVEWEESAGEERRRSDSETDTCRSNAPGGGGPFFFGSSYTYKREESRKKSAVADTNTFKSLNSKGLGVELNTGTLGSNSITDDKTRNSTSKGNFGTASVEGFRNAQNAVGKNIKRSIEKDLKDKEKFLKKYGKNSMVKGQLQSLKTQAAKISNIVGKHKGAFSGGAFGISSSNSKDIKDGKDKKKADNSLEKVAKAATVTNGNAQGSNSGAGVNSSGININFGDEDDKAPNDNTPSNFDPANASGLSENEIDNILGNIKKSKYEGSEFDTLWRRVSKAYVRGAFPVLLKPKPKSKKANEGFEEEKIDPLGIKKLKTK